ncbi:uncharacterized protein LOC105842515 isoform X2 [Bombyx mori]|uniref:Uncharacterized protein n=1 Tax=Bombyx mori TaxID=7091 RepID=A0A8R2C981_BOMMO|nr:uncharacterized protein LOC105842515 isoform X2 [Bombyx mori]
MNTNISHYTKDRPSVLGLRLATLVVVIALLTMHLRSVRVFRWEQSVSGGLLVTYSLSTLGLALCAGIERCGGNAFQAFICGVGSALFAVNAATIWRRWRNVDDLTRVVAELLDALGVRLGRQIIIKVLLSTATAVLLLVDLVLSPLLRPYD